jgi:hypothetical protein
MIIRHKQHGFVSMWMLDVFCCALGCVTLLWLLKTREAGFALEQSENLQASLLISQQGLQAESAQTQRLKVDLDQSEKNLTLRLKELESQGKKLALILEQNDRQAKQLALMQTEIDAQAKRLALMTDEAREAATQLATAKENEAALRKRAADQATTMTRSDAQIEELKRTIAAATAQAESAEKKARQANAELQDERKRQAMASQTQSELKKQLERSQLELIDLQGTKAKLADKIDKLQIEAENRFAGIAMTGKRVIFMVDMSGSMERIDHSTAAPAKWQTVAETLGKVMRTIPDLEKFQIVLFSNRVVWPLGQPGEWKEFRRDQSPQEATAALKAVKPAGETNMYEALEAVFKMRSNNLDTIYLFSDGLPNAGPGLSLAEERANLRETERSEILARHIRSNLNQNWNRPDAQGKKVRINAIGFFFESPDVGAFLWTLSRDNEGSFVGMSKP